MTRTSHLVLLLTAVAAAILASTANAKTRVRCGSGVTIYRDGPLRVFGIHFNDHSGVEGGFSGYDEYACVGTSRRPVGIGTTGSNAGTGSSDVPALAFDGSRYLAVALTDDGEGGPDLDYDLVDLKTGRSLHSPTGLCCGDDNDVLWPFRAGADGSLITDELSIGLYQRGNRRQTLSATAGTPSELALSGATIYWTEDGAIARSALLPGPLPDGEDHVLEPVEVSTKPDCARHGSTTLLRSARVQIYTRRSSTGRRRRYACRIGHRGSFPLAPAGSATQTRAARDLRIAGGRFVLAFDTYTGTAGKHDVLQVADMRRGRIVTTIDTPAITHATLLTDGTVAWIEAGGRVLSQAAGATTRTVLAEAGTAPTALAAGRKTIYWTAGGTPNRAAG